jgi:hypothetical protein
MPRAGFKPTIPVLEWAKTVHALDCAANVIVTFEHGASRTSAQSLAS